KKHEREVHLIAQTLLEKETLDLEQIEELIKKGSLESSESGEGAAEAPVGKDDIRINIGTQDNAEAKKSPTDEENEEK
ncbi:MAG TPA: cell division protein FtsH, partial [Paenibacillus sp.]|nr:cell division protein FtsH [Paenibacillus sp.]